MEADKSQIQSPYLCKQETKLTVHDKQLEELVTINKELKDNIIKLTELNSRIDTLEKSLNNVRNKLWYIAGGTIIALIGAFIKLIL